jgi:hypothetical protein
VLLRFGNGKITGSVLERHSLTGWFSNQHILLLKEQLEIGESS